MKQAIVHDDRRVVLNNQALWIALRVDCEFEHVRGMFLALLEDRLKELNEGLNIRHGIQPTD